MDTGPRKGVDYRPPFWLLLRQVPGIPGKGKEKLMTKLEHLFQPIQIGAVEIRNRIVRPGVLDRLGDGDRVTERMKAFFTAQARGGVGLIVTGAAEAIDLGEPQPGGIAIHSDDFVPGLRELVNAVHANGAKIGLQVAPRDMWRRDKDSSVEVVGPSDVPVNPRGGHKPRPLTVEEIKQIEGLVAEAVRRAREAGFDLVEFHIGIATLINQFTSPYTNRRTDGYGGSLENRLAFFMEILDEVRKKVGSDYTLAARISGADMMEGGLTVEDNAVIAPMLEKAGIAAINVTTGWHEAPVLSFQPPVPPGTWIYMAETIKKAVSIPVVTGTRIPDVVLADRIIAEGKADMVYMARPLIADPELANKADEGRLDDIRPCIGCLRCFEKVVVDMEPVECSVNAQAGRELELTIEPAPQPRRVLVVGGGPGGMEAARVAALRGHRVTLMEKSDRLGGQLLVASVAPSKGDLAKLVDYLSRQVEKLGVEVKLGCEVTPDTVAETKPDAVIVAAGASPLIPDLPGARGSNVVTAVDVLAGKVDVGENVVVIGGGMVGCEVAEHLVGRGKRVTILEKLGRIGEGIGRGMRWVVMQRLRALPIRMETGVQVEEITNKGVRIVRSGESEFYEGDAIVLAMGLVPENTLAKELEVKVSSLCVIGDAVEPRRVAQAIESAFRAAREM
ncbi:FAD-dependent oxidoreductase [Chloroflexota bacterium]